MPQFDVATFPTQLVWLAITFVVLYFAMARMALPRIGQVLDERQKRIDDNLDKAETLKGEADTEAAAYAKVLAEAREQSRGVISEVTRQASGDSARRHLASGHDHVASNRAERAFVRRGLGQMCRTKPVQ